VRPTIPNGTVTTAVSLANGPTATALNPIQLSRSTTASFVVAIDGANLTGATGVRFVGIENDISVAAPLVSADGARVTVEVFVLPSAPLGRVSVVVSGPGWSTQPLANMQVEIVP
jgi:hypothetical protein